ncbi:MAG: glycosyltransferase [Actinomycetes bacterium]
MDDVQPGTLAAHRLLLLIITNSRPGYLRLMLDSVDAQTCRDFSVLLIDNGSTDSTGDVIAEWVASTTLAADVQRNEVNGFDFLGGLLGELVDRTDYVICAGDDDILLPGHIEAIRDVMAEKPDAVLVSTAVEYIDQHGERTGAVHRPAVFGRKSRAALVAQLMSANCLVPAATAFQLRPLVQRVTITRYVYALDYWMWLVLAVAGEASFSDKVTIQYRIHSTQISTTVTRAQDTLEVSLILDEIVRSSEFNALLSTLGPGDWKDLLQYLAEGVGLAFGREPFASFLQLVLLDALERAGATGPLYERARFQAVAGFRGELTYATAGRQLAPTHSDPWPQWMWRRSGVAAAVASGSCQRSRALSALVALGLDGPPDDPSRVLLLLSCDHVVAKRRPNRSIAVHYPCSLAGMAPDLRESERLFPILEPDSLLDWTFLEPLLRLVCTPRFSEARGPLKWYEARLLAQMERVRAMAPDSTVAYLRRRVLRIAQ